VTLCYVETVTLKWTSLKILINYRQYSINRCKNNHVNFFYGSFESILKNIVSLLNCSILGLTALETGD
jgi:hypothetical protein